MTREIQAPLCGNSKTSDIISYRAGQPFKVTDMRIFTIIRVIENHHDQLIRSLSVPIQDNIFCLPVPEPNHSDAAVKTPVLTCILRKGSVLKAAGSN